jgi:hypothetical protein
MPLQARRQGMPREPGSLPFILPVLGPTPPMSEITLRDLYCRAYGRPVLLYPFQGAVAESFGSRRGLTQPDRTGLALRPEFPDAVPGPLALGFGCHFRLGLFRAVKN